MGEEERGQQDLSRGEEKRGRAEIQKGA